MKWVNWLIAIIVALWGRKKLTALELLIQGVIKDVKEMVQKKKELEYKKELARNDDDVILFRDIVRQLSSLEEARNKRLIQFATAILHQQGLCN